MVINKMMTKWNIYNDDKHTQSENELNRYQNHTIIDETFWGL